MVTPFQVTKSSPATYFPTPNDCYRAGWFERLLAITFGQKVIARDIGPSLTTELVLYEWRGKMYYRSFKCE